MNPTPRTTALALLLLTLAATTTFLPAQPADPPPAAQSEPSEETIRLAVENQLLRSESVEGHGIEVRYGEPSAPHFYGTHYYVPE